MSLVVASVLLSLALDGAGKVEDVAAVVQSWGTRAGYSYGVSEFEVLEE